MKIRRKTNRCLNCFRNIDQIYNFCPNCGQENTNRNVSFGYLINEFFNNYLSFDSKFGRSIAPFFLRPGKLTKEFINGRRVNYANPIRLYLILSLFYFFVLSQFNLYQNKDEGTGNISFSVDNQDIIVQDSVNQKPKINTDEIIESIPDTTELWPFQTKENLTIFFKLKDKKEFTDAQVYDSLDTSNSTTMERLALKQSIRVSRASNKEMMGYIIEQMPLLMFILMPIFALVLKLLYVRRDKNYIIHLVHSLHLHSFKFFILGITTLAAIFTPTVVSIILILSALGVSMIYEFISFKNVYEQSFLKTYLKYNLYVFLYLFFHSVGMVIEMLLSLAFY